MADAFAFFGFCVLSLLIAAYLLDRQRTFRSIKQQLVAELQRNIDLRHQADADLLHTIPDLNHFQDRLAMEYRRASAMEQRSLAPGRQSKRLSHVTDHERSPRPGRRNRARHRPQSSGRPIPCINWPAAFFGVVLSDTDTATAKKLTAKLEPTIRTSRAEEQIQVRNVRPQLSRQRKKRPRARTSHFLPPARRTKLGRSPLPALKSRCSAKPLSACESNARLFLLRRFASRNLVFAIFRC